MDPLCLADDAGRAFWRDGSGSLSEEIAAPK